MTTAHSDEDAPSLVRRSAAKLRGLAQLVTSGHAPARALAITDSRALVRSLFLSSAARTGLLTELGASQGASLDELAAFVLARQSDDIAAVRTDRLAAWLSVGCELKEIERHDGRYRVRGRRARAIATGDPILAAHYRSVLDYQGAPYEQVLELLVGPPGTGRQDLTRFADEIAQVSRAATPFVASLVRQVVAELAPRRVLDAGCGTAVYARVVLEADPAVLVTGVDLSPEVITQAKADLTSAGFGARISMEAADIMAWAAHRGGQEPDAGPVAGVAGVAGGREGSGGSGESGESAGSLDRTFDLIMLHNNIYYFAPAARHELLHALGRLLNPHGHILLSTMTTPGSVASAHLHLMLVAQARMAGLPSEESLRADVAQAGLVVTWVGHPVPTEPYLALRAGASQRPP